MCWYGWSGGWVMYGGGGAEFPAENKAKQSKAKRTLTDGVQVFLTDMANFAEMNATYEKFFTHKPARSCVAVKQLPKGVPVEIECVALE